MYSVCKVFAHTHTHTHTPSRRETAKKLAKNSVFSIELKKEIVCQNMILCVLVLLCFSVRCKQKKKKALTRKVFVFFLEDTVH